MNQGQGLVAEAAVDREVADVGRDDFRLGEAFGEDDEGGVTGVHLGVMSEKGRGAVAVVGPNRDEVEPFLLHHADEHEYRGPFETQKMTSLTENDFGGEYRFVERRNHSNAPRVPLVTGGKRPDQGACVYEVSNCRSLHASRGRAVRF